MNLISCQNLCKSYGNKAVIKNIDLQLDAGHPIALVGPNGAGKTTLMSLLLGYIHPSSGSVSVLGHNAGSEALLKLVSALPQDAILNPDFTLLTQLTLFARMQGFNKADAKTEALRVLALVDLVDCAKQKPKQLSHGMGKRVAIAQALIGTPKLVLLDEPTAGIDPVNARKIRNLIEQLSDKITFIISSHNLDELERLCDRVIYLEEGKLKQSLCIQHETEHQQGFITLQMQSDQDEEFLASIQELTGVINITVKAQQTFIIEYDLSNSLLDIELLQLLASQNRQYKMLLKGRTLEETLFS